MKNPVCVVIPNWDGADMILPTIESLKKQSLLCDIIVVDNGSKDASLALLRPMAAAHEITLIVHAKNLGFSGGVNAGFTHALAAGYEAIIAFNNDAIADENWAKYLYETLMKSPKTGAVACKMLSADGKTMDSTGDWLTNWGLPYPRGRGEVASGKYDQDTNILAASGGASIFRAQTLREVGLFDDDFFAYYEDVDLGLRIRLAGWEIVFEPRAFVLHATSSTGNRVKGFTTLQTMKNLPWILVKDIPWPLLWRMIPRFALAYCLFFGRAIADGRGLWALKGLGISILKFPKKVWQRGKIQRARKITPAQLDALIYHDLPPNATKLRALRNKWWSIRGKA